MERIAGRSGDRRVLNFLPVIAALAVMMIAFSTPATAHPGGPARHAPRGLGHGHHKHGHHNKHHNKMVPRVIAADWRAFYSPYVAGRAYYAPHRHHHVRYLFPVHLNGAVVYEPYVYCGSRLLVSEAVALPRLAIGVHFGSPGGLFIGGYGSYGSPVSVDGVHDRRHYHDRDCDHEWDD